MLPIDCPPLAKPPGMHRLVTNNNIVQDAFIDWYGPGRFPGGAESRLRPMVRAQISGDAIFSAAKEHVSRLHVGMSGLFQSFDRLRAADEELPSDVEDAIEAELAALLQRINN